ncbi:MAG TPA: PAS domain S-box protein [Nitrosospira sp.]|nr:PAS domain S-box protein [Nitrosospira sp.]
MSALIHDHDWSGSGLGSISAWPAPLQTSVGIVLSLPTPAMLLWGPNFIQIHNDACRGLMPIKHAAALGQPVSLGWPEIWYVLKPACEAVMQRGESFIFDGRQLDIERSGMPEKAFFRLTCSPVPGGGGAGNADGEETGSPGGMLVTISETNAPIGAYSPAAQQGSFEQALSQREEHFRRVLEIETIGIVFFDAEGRITSSNKAFREMSGFECEEEREKLSGGDEAMPENWPEDWKEWISSLPQAVFDIPPGQCAIPQEKEFARKDGSRWWALISSKKLNEREGVQYVIDITGRKRAEQALRESEARFRAMAEASPALTWRVDAGGNAVYLNQRFRELIGMTLEELMPIGWRSIIHPDDAKRYLAAFEEALRKHSRFQQRVRIRVANGEWHWLISYALPWFTANDEYAGHAGVSIDITDAVTAESALLEADRRKDEFLATLAHELRNPLGPISNGLALIAGPEGAAALPQLLPMIIRQVRNIERLVDDLLEASRITSGKLELHQGPMRLAMALRSAIEASMPLVNEKEHELTVFIPERSLVVYADPARLAQVFSNLLNNAARYTKKRGHIWLTARQEGEEAVVSVRDNGIGILPGMLSRIFDIFAQERRNGRGHQEGLGIGLSLVHRLVQMHGGMIEARSEGRDEGSEFIVRLPLCEAPEAAENAGPGKNSPPPLGLRVLVVDDNRDAAEVLAMLLESIGVNAQAVNGGPAALAAIPNYQPNVILMDIGMPGMDGHEVARRIRKQSQFNDIKLIALTGWGQEKDRRDSSKAGFDHHLTKPVDFKVLKDLIIEMQNAHLTQS